MIKIIKIIIKKNNNKNLNYNKVPYSTYFFINILQQKKLLITKSFNEILNFEKSNNYKLSFAYESRINKFFKNDNLNKKKRLITTFMKRT